MAFVQKWQTEVSGGSVTSANVTLGTDATAGNILIAVVFCREGFDSAASATGWTEVGIDYGDAAQGAAFYYRVATGDSNDNFALTWTGDTNVGSVLIGEFSDSGTLSLDQSNESGLATGTSAGTGSIAPSTSDGVVIAVLGVQRNAHWYEDGAQTVSIDGDFSIDAVMDTPLAGGPAQPVCWLASFEYSSTSAISPTLSTTDTGGPYYAGIVNFTNTAGGSSPVAKIMQQLI